MAKAPTGNRVKIVSALFSPREYKMVRRVALMEGRSMSSYLRSLAFADLDRRGIQAVPDDVFEEDEEVDDEGDDI